MFKIIRGIKKLIILLTIIVLVVSIAFVVMSAKYPIGYKTMIVKYSEMYELDPYLIASIINVESRYDKNATSPKNARGLMQIGPQTGEWASQVLGIENYTEELLFDPEVNINMGTWYIRTLFKEFNGNLDLVLAAYNAGSGNVNKWLNDEEYCSDGANLSKIPFKETEDYLEKVKKGYNIYSTVYKRYIMSPNENDSFYISLLHNIKRTLEQFIGSIR